MSFHRDHMFENLESGNKEEVEKVKYSIREMFSKVNEPWLIHGLYDYYLHTNSARCLEVIITLREPHQQFLYERLGDSIKHPKTEMKVQALTLLGHIARSQPTWLYTLSQHALFKEIIEFLKNENELLPLISALLLLIVLLPMFPSYIGPHLEDIFVIFGRFAAWNSHVPGKMGEDQMIHLQVALYALFLRLYGMYPCNFLTYLRANFKDNNNPVFCHTIKPMMDTVKMHPSLVTTSKESETTTERWRTMGVHDVIVECERFSLDITDRCPHETCQNTTEFRSRSGTMNSTVGSTPINESSYHQQNIRSLASLQMSNNEGSFFSPSQLYQIQTPPITESTGISHRPLQGLINRSNYAVQEGSPPEAAIEATPETTPIRDFTATAQVMPLPSKTNVARALTSFRTNSSGFIVSGTPTNSVPSSPMRKEPSSSPFVFPAGGAFTPVGQGGMTANSLSQHLAYRLTQERQSTPIQQQVSDGLTNSKPPPSSPLKILNPDTSTRQRVESPMSQEDEEFSSMSASAGKWDRHARRKSTRPYENSLPDCEDSDVGTQGGDDLEHGSPCAAGGLHMPNSKSITNFRTRIQRFRYNSQCAESDRKEMSTGSSPGNGLPFVSNSAVRRTNSCPDMKKSPQVPSKDRSRKPFYETDEETVSEDQVSNNSNGLETDTKKKRFSAVSSATQTEVFWPMPYEHLFLSIFPSLKEESPEVNANAAPSPAPALTQTVEQYKPSLYDILDKYIEKCVAAADNNNSLKDQLQLTHQQLLFERHRRETHAYRNRRLLSDAKSTRLLEEYNSALRDQVQLEHKEIDDLRKQLEEYRRETVKDQEKLQDNIRFMQEKCINLTDENSILKEINRKLESDLSTYKAKCNCIDKERQQAQAALLDALAEGKVAREQAALGEKVKQELQRVNRELLLMGELHIKYRERLENLQSMQQSDQEMRQISEAYREEIKGLQHVIEGKTVTMDAYKSRVVELEHILASKEKIGATQKQTLESVNRMREVLLEAVESKYQTQLNITRKLEEQILALHAATERDRRTQSPDTSSCHEAQASSITTGGAAGGLSPQHSSPLSASLASSEGSAAMQELRNLQMYVDQEGSSKTNTDEPGGTLGKND